MSTRALIAAALVVAGCVALAVAIARLSPWLLLGWPIAWVALAAFWAATRGEREPYTDETGTERSTR